MPRPEHSWWSNAPKQESGSSSRLLLGTPGLVACGCLYAVSATHAVEWQEMGQRLVAPFSVCSQQAWRCPGLCAERGRRDSNTGCMGLESLADVPRCMLRAVSRCCVPRTSCCVLSKRGFSWDLWSDPIGVSAVTCGDIGGSQPLGVAAVSYTGHGCCCRQVARKPPRDRGRFACRSLLRMLLGGVSGAAAGTLQSQQGWYPVVVLAALLTPSWAR
jgi:hypothetical protein